MSKVETTTTLYTRWESERLKTALLDAITHEFRTPLTAIKISVTSMLSDLNFDREQCKDLLSMIDEGCDLADHSWLGFGPRTQP